MNEPTTNDTQKHPDLTRVFLGDFDLPFPGHPTSWEWDEQNIECLAALFCKQFRRKDLVVRRYQGNPHHEWGFGYKDHRRLPLFVAKTPRELGRMGLAYLTGYRIAKELVEEQARWINAAQGAMKGLQNRTIDRAM